MSLRTSVAAAILWSCVYLYGQSTGEVAGIVTDQSGAAVPGATLEITDVVRNMKSATVAASDGNYRFASLQPGSYQLIARHPGFSETRVTQIVVEVNRISRVDATLQVAAGAAQITVDASAQLIDLESGAKGTTITIRQARDLPLASRNPLALMQLTPGVVSPPATGGGVPTASRQGSDGTGASSGYTINGGLRRGSGGFQEYIVDGISITSQRDGIITALPASDALQEFRVQSGGMSAEYGRTVGGVVNYVTSGGTNELHGNLFESVRNTALNARRAIPAVGSKPLAQFNQFGGTLGGPVVVPRLYNGRNRTFFFVGYEGSRFVRKNPTVANVPTALMRQGDFSETPTLIYDPASASAAADRTPFAGNRIPANRINAIGRTMIGRFPAANVAGLANNYDGFFRAFTPVDNYTGRLDQSFNQNHRLFFRHTRAESVNDAIFNLGDSDAQTAKSDIPQRSYVASYNWTVSPSVIFSATGGYTRFARALTDPSGNKDGSGYFGYFVSPAPRDLVNIRPIATFDIYRPLGTRDIFDQTAETWQLNNSLIWNKGRHTIRFGSDLRRYVAGGQLTTGAVNGNFSFAPAQTSRGTANTGYSAASLLLGLPNTATFAQPPRLRASKDVLAFFVQDDLRLTSRLTLNLGMRFDIEGALSEKENRSGYFDPAAVNSLAGIPGVFQYSTGAAEKAITKPDYNGISPRVGFAYALDSSGRTALRGAIGAYNGPVPTDGYFSAALGFEPILDFVRANAQAPAVVLRDSYTLPAAAGPIGPAAYLGIGVPQPYGQTLPTPRIYQWNFGIQHELARNTVLDILYTGNRGQGLHGARNINFAAQALLQEAINLTNTTGNPAAAQSFLNAQVPNPLAGKVPGTLGAATVTRAQSSVPFPHYSTITSSFNNTDSIYHALQATAQRRFAGDLSLSAAYTFSKLISNTDGTQDPHNMREGRSVNALDRTHLASASAVYALPFGKGKRFTGPKLFNALAGGFQLTSILQVYSGAPIGVTQSAANGLGVGVSRPDAVGDTLALGKAVRGKVLASGNVQWMDRAAYQLVNGRYGSAPARDVRLREPGLWQIDLGLHRDFRLTERAGLRFRAEAFNALNHTNLAPPDMNLSSPTFGQISAVQDPRVFQLGLEIRF